MGTSIAGAQAPELLNAKGVSLTAVSDEGSAPRPRKLLKKFDQNFYIDIAGCEMIDRKKALYKSKAAEPAGCAVQRL